ncbi:MAG TPA: hypothetical protein VHC94_11660 [Nitrobacter sp.]|jgi:hypothetical protein|nr:hypothetical protein [Nitrobacter sp.]
MAGIAATDTLIERDGAAAMLFKRAMPPRGEGRPGTAMDDRGVGCRLRLCDNRQRYRQPRSAHWPVPDGAAVTLSLTGL